MGPNGKEGEESEGLMTENGEPRMLVGLLEAELLGCCEDMAREQAHREDGLPSTRHSEGTR